MTQSILFLSIFVSLHSVSAVTINKCCPVGSYILANITCSNVTQTPAPDNFRWFPKSSMYNITSKEKLSPEEQNQLVNEALAFSYSKYNICRGAFFKLFVNELAEHFHILVKDSNEMMVKTGDPLDEAKNLYANFPKATVHSNTSVLENACPIEDKGIQRLIRVVNGSLEKLNIDIFCISKTQLKKIEKSMWTLPMDEVCFDLIQNRFTVVIYCPGKSKPWIRKCCAAGSFYNVTKHACSMIPQFSNITDWVPHNASRELKNFFVAVPPADKFPSCTNHMVLRSPERARRCKGMNNPVTKFYFLGNGSVRAHDTIINPDDYCGDKTWHSETEIFEQNLIYCPTVSREDYTKFVYGSLFIAGGFCLLLTVSISLLLPELRKRIHNKIAITHNATLMTAHFLWGANQFATQRSVFLGFLMSSLIQFTFLGSLFWLNAMCINMSSTFRTTQTLNITTVRSEMRRYWIYSLYAWGLTGLITIFTLAMELSEQPIFGLPRPGFTCYQDFDRKSYSVFAYFYGPMAIILIFNLVLYIFTTWKIISVQRQTTILHHTDSKTAGGASLQTDQQRLILYTKLFLLMGLTWATEIIGWAVGGDNYFWIILDVINLLRAVFIFVIFICKRPVLRSLRRHLERATGHLRKSSSFSRSMTEAVSLSTMGPSRKASQDGGSRKKSREQDEYGDIKRDGRLEDVKRDSLENSDLVVNFEFEQNDKS